MAKDMAPNKDEQVAVGGRRDFLKAMTGASAAAAATVVGASAPAEAQSSAPATNGSERETKEERVKARYQPDAPDVQAFYRTNRY